mgnify:CR=1 FL=1
MKWGDKMNKKDVENALDALVGFRCDFEFDSEYFHIYYWLTWDLLPENENQTDGDGEYFHVVTIPIARSVTAEGLQNDEIRNSENLFKNQITLSEFQQYLNLGMDVAFDGIFRERFCVDKQHEIKKEMDWFFNNDSLLKCYIAYLTVCQYRDWTILNEKIAERDIETAQQQMRNKLKLIK